MQGLFEILDLDHPAHESGHGFQEGELGPREGTELVEEHEQQRLDAFPQTQGAAQRGLVGKVLGAVQVLCMGPGGHVPDHEGTLGMFHQPLAEGGDGRGRFLAFLFRVPPAGFRQPAAHHHQGGLGRAQLIHQQFQALRQNERIARAPRVVQGVDGPGQTIKGGSTGREALGIAIQEPSIEQSILPSPFRQAGVWI